MIDQCELEHAVKGLKLLTDAFKSKPVIEAISKSFLNRADELELELWRLIWGWVLEHVDPDDPANIYNAEGQQLDDLGAIVGQPREGRDDPDYVAAIKLRVRINRSKGRSSDMVEIAALINVAMSYVEYFPLGWECSLYNIANGGDLIRLLTQAKAATSYGVLLTSDFAESLVSKFSYQGGSPAANEVFGTVYASTPDVRFCAALPTNPPYRRA